MTQKIQNCDNLENIHSLEHLNDLLTSKTLANSIEVSYASRVFTLASNHCQYRVTMKAIVAKFQELAADKDSKKEMIGIIYGRIVQLNLEGDVRLSEMGFGSTFFRDLKNFLNVFFTSHDVVLNETTRVITYAPNEKDTFVKINGTFESFLPRDQVAPCWMPIKTHEAVDLQNTLNHCVDPNFNEVEEKLKSYQKENHFFCLSEGQFYEVNPGNFKPVQIKIQVKEGTITWYITNAQLNETTQEFRNQVFRTAALGHLLVKRACNKYYRGTNSMHIKRMHTSETESSLNHNHYRVENDHVTPAQFQEHLYGFLEAQKAYGFADNFLTQREADDLIKQYENFDAQQNIKDDGVKTRRETFHEREQLKWTDLDIQELNANKAIEEPCKAQRMNVPLNGKKITVTTTTSTLTIWPSDWINHQDVLDSSALDIISQAGSEGQKSDLAQTRQIQHSKLPTQLKAFHKFGELFPKDANNKYPTLPKKKAKS